MTTSRSHAAPRASAPVRLVASAALLCATAACTSGAPSALATDTAAATVTATVTATATVTVTLPAVTIVVTASPTVDSAAWPMDTDVQGEAPSPEFPATLAGWQLVDSWSDLPRAFTGDTWSQPSGPYDYEFPDTMNGCNDQRFLVRWRAVNESAVVLARWNMQDIEFGEPTVANAGWMDLDGCRAPEFNLSDETTDGSTLTDVTVSLQRWTPAP